jgi:hypothetical protein
MTITITEMILFAWAILATAVAIQRNERVKALMFVVNGMLKDDEFLARVRSEYDEISGEHL